MPHKSHSNSNSLLSKIELLRGGSDAESVISITDTRQLISIPSSSRHRCYLSPELSSGYPLFDEGEFLVSLKKLFDDKNIPLVLDPRAKAESSEVYLREEASQRLLKAACFLSDITDNELCLKVLHAYSPFPVVVGDLEPERTSTEPANPDNETTHSSGGAIDVTLAFRKKSQEVEMGSSWPQSGEIAHTWSREVSRSARFNRALLYVAMTTAGFVNIPKKWWHYSFGDRYWAAFLDKPYAMYASLPRIRVAEVSD